MSPPAHEREQRSGQPRFIADAMLGKLARWLRMMGLDTIYDPTLADAELVARAAAEDRVLLTRDASLARRRLAKKAMLLNSDDWKEQLRQVVTTFGLKAAWESDRRGATRCVACNGTLEAVKREDVRFEVPVHIYQEHEAFKRCRECGHVYWRGSHQAVISKVLKDLLHEGASEAGK